VSLPILIVLFFAILGAYSLVMSRAAGQVPPPQQRWHLVSFTIGLLVTLAIFIPSPDLFGPDHRFSVSMGQMLFALVLAPPLLLHGIPYAVIKSFLPDTSSQNRPPNLLLWGFISTVILCAWFIPVFFEAASRNLPIWLVKQMLFLISGLIMWLPVMGIIPSWKQYQSRQLIYMAIMRLPMAFLGILLTFANKLIYTSSSFALEICAPSSLQDQQVGGLLMWAVGGWVLFLGFTILFIRWFKASETAESQ